MSDEIELVSDGEGVAVVGKKSAVERFLRERGLFAISENLRLDKLGDLAQVADAVVSGASEIAAQSGRWVKLTEESAALVKEFGFMATKSRGISHTMIGDPGSISKWTQVETNAGTILTNPAALAGAAGVMAQLARQQEMREIKAYLAQIGSKVSDVIRAQQDAKHSKLAGARGSIDRAMSVREAQGGRTDPTTWSTVQDRVGGVDDSLSWALIRLNRVVEKLEGEKHAGQRAKLAKVAEDEVAELLAVIAHCFELQDALDVMRLDRVLEESPHNLDDQRAALEKHRQDRRSSIVEATARLVGQIDDAAGTANSNVLLHPKAARSVTGSANKIGGAIVEFHAPLGIESEREGVESPARWEAVQDGKQLETTGKEAGPKLIVPALLIGGAVLYKVPATRPIATKAFAIARQITGK